MIVLRVVVNALIMAIEFAAVAGIAWLGWKYPFEFAGATAVIAFLLGAYLHYEHLKFEYPFYFEGRRTPYLIVLRLISLGESIVGGLVAGLVALITFSGADDERRMAVAVCFAVAVFAGSSLLRRMSISLGAIPARWGFFRLAVPLGLVFSCGIAFAASLGYIRNVTLSDIGRQLVFEIPTKPNIDQVSDLLFNLKLYIDGVVASLLANLMTLEWAQILSLIISVNVLTGFIVAVYTVLIAEAVRWLERRSQF
ncbi:MAG: hypothetical protein RIC14_15180 [Filomicrobium sp.]